MAKPLSLLRLSGQSSPWLSLAGAAWVSLLSRPRRASTHGTNADAIIALWQESSSAIVSWRNARALAPQSFLPRSLAVQPQGDRSESGQRLRPRALKTRSLAVIGDEVLCHQRAGGTRRWS